MSNFTKHSLTPVSDPLLLQISCQHDFAQCSKDLFEATFCKAVETVAENISPTRAQTVFLVR